MSGPEVTQPKQFGSHRSRLVLSLLNDEAHRKDVALSGDEWETLVTWVDANAPYHATYFQYFDAQGKLLPHAIRVRIELDPPFQPGEKTQRIVEAPAGPATAKSGLTASASSRPNTRVVSGGAMRLAAHFAAAAQECVSGIPFCESLYCACPQPATAD